GDVLEREVPVLEKRQEPEVQNDRAQEEQAPLSRVLLTGNRASEQEIDRRRAEDERQIADVPSSVKPVACGEQQRDPELAVQNPRARDEPGNDKSSGEEDGVLFRREKHGDAGGMLNGRLPRAKDGGRCSGGCWSEF